MKNEIIEFAEKAGLLRAVFACDEVLVWEAETKHLERFAALVAEKATEQANAVLMSLCQEAADALAAPVQEPVAIPEYIRDAAKHLHKNRFESSVMVRAIVGWINGFPPAQPAPVQGCDFCKHPLYAGTKCKNCGTAPVQEPVAYLFTNVQSGDIEASTNPDHKEGEREMWYREPLVRPPAQPAVPDAIGPNEDELPAYAAGWNDCRQAMLEMMK
jgi:hypothetical protein